MCVTFVLFIDKGELKALQGIEWRGPVANLEDTCALLFPAFKEAKEKKMQHELFEGHKQLSYLTGLMNERGDAFWKKFLDSDAARWVIDDLNPPTNASATAAAAVSGSASAAGAVSASASAAAAVSAWSSAAAAVSASASAAPATTASTKPMSPILSKKRKVAHKRKNPSGQQSTPNPKRRKVDKMTRSRKQKEEVNDDSNSESDSDLSDAKSCDDTSEWETSIDATASDNKRQFDWALVDDSAATYNDNLEWIRDILSKPRFQDSMSFRSCAALASYSHSLMDLNVALGQLKDYYSGNKHKLNFLEIKQRLGAAIIEEYQANHLLETDLHQIGSVARDIAKARTRSVQDALKDVPLAWSKQTDEQHRALETQFETVFLERCGLEIISSAMSSNDNCFAHCIRSKEQQQPTMASAAATDASAAATDASAAATDASAAAVEPTILSLNLTHKAGVEMVYQRKNYEIRALKNYNQLEKLKHFETHPSTIDFHIAYRGDRFNRDVKQIILAHQLDKTQWMQQWVDVVNSGDSEPVLSELKGWYAVYVFDSGSDFHSPLSEIRRSPMTGTLCISSHSEDSTLCYFV